LAVNCDAKVKLIPKAVGAVANERVGRAEALDGAVAIVGLPAVRGEGAGIDCALDPQKARGFEALSGFAAVIAVLNIRERRRPCRHGWRTSARQR
jgi:hypothetical protein